MALYAFDGTCNTSDVTDEQQSLDDTNVVRFYEAYTGKRWYVSGPGTRLGRLGKTVGAVTGAGARDRVQEAYKQLVNDYGAGDTQIDIVGFSRGAAIALDFANLIAKQGVHDFESGRTLARGVQIRFLGLWDVVGSFGIPIGDRLFQSLNIGHELSVPDNVEYAYHAIALDERRQTFRPTRQLKAYEVWFRGVHSDIGGGNENVALSSIPLRWMLRKAAAAGVPVTAAAFTACDGLVNCDAAVKPEFDPVIQDYRHVWPSDRVHYTVSERVGCNNPHSTCLRETEADEFAANPRAELTPTVPPEPARRPAGALPSHWVGADG